MPNIDLSIYEFDNVDIRGTIFAPETILPKDKLFFKKVRANSIANTKLPIIDMSHYDFTEFNIRGCKFAKGTLPPTDLDFFQHVKFRNISGTVFSDIDLSKFNFKSVNMQCASFKNCIAIPEIIDLIETACNVVLVAEFPLSTYVSLKYLPKYYSMFTLELMKDKLVSNLSIDELYLYKFSVKEFLD